MADDPGINMPRFYIRAAFVIGVLALLASLRFQSDMVAGVLAGGALSLVNLREMHKGLRVVLRMERPSSRRLLFSGILRLIILASVIIVIARMRLVNLLGLLVGFGIIPILLMGEGLLYIRKMQSLENREGPACSTRPRQ